MASPVFAFALREHVRVWGAVPGYYGATPIAGHIAHSEKTDFPCSGWVIPEGAKAVPDYSYDFAGTDADPQHTHIIRLDTPVSCECGQLRDKRIQVEGTMSELLTRLLKIEVPNEVVL